MNKIIVSAITILSLFACQTPTPTNDSSEVKDSVQVAKYGDISITETGAVSMADLIAKMQGKDSAQIKVTGKINQCCKKKGCWMTVDMGNGNEMRVSFKDYAFFVPKNADGMTATFEGWAYVDTLSVESQKHYLKDEGASAEEINAVKEAKPEWSFIASGVIIKSN